MKPWDWIKLIEDDGYKVLGEIPPADPFWKICRHVLCDWIPYKTEVAFVDSDVFPESTLNVEIFPKILECLCLSSDMSEDNIWKILTTVLATCNREEWLGFYKPVLSRTLELPFTIGQYNLYSPHPIIFAEEPVSKNTSKFPGREMMLEPYIDGECAFVVIYKDSIELLDKNCNAFFSKSISLDAFFPVLDDSQLHEPVILFGYFDHVEKDKEYFILSDIFTPSTVAGVPLVKRHSILADTYRDYVVKDTGILLIDRTISVPGEHKKNVNIILDTGYNSVRIRDSELAFDGCVDLIFTPT